MPIVVASGYEEADLRRRFGQDAYLSYIGKPYTRDQVQGAVGEMIRH